MKLNCCNLTYRESWDPYNLIKNYKDRKYPLGRAVATSYLSL